MSAPLVPIPLSDVRQMLGKRVHVQGWSPGCVFVLKALDWRTLRAELRTPRGNRRYTVPLDRLAYTRLHEPREDVTS